MFMRTEIYQKIKKIYIIIIIIIRSLEKFQQLHPFSIVKIEIRHDKICVILVRTRCRWYVFVISENYTSVDTRW